MANRYTPQSPCCAPHRHTMLGCNSQPYIAGATVVLKNGGTTLETHTTDASGNVFFTHFASGLTVQAAAPHTRFGPVTATVTTVPGGHTTSTYAPASGYHCDAGTSCLFPLADTLQVGGTGAWTGSVNYDTLLGYWSDTLTYNQPACAGCGSGGHACPAVSTVPVQVQYNRQVVPSVRWRYYEDAFGCPTTALLGTLGSWRTPLNSVGDTCFVPGTSAFSFSTVGQSDPAVRGLGMATFWTE